jgi:hypothetical protein
MSRYIMIRRLRGPVFLLLVGALALLNQAHVLSWHQSWPFFLILWGVQMLAERAALAAEGGYPPGPYPGPYSGPNQAPYQGQYPGAVDPAAVANQAQPPTPPGSAIVSSPAYGLVKESSDPEGGQS